MAESFPWTAVLVGLAVMAVVLSLAAAWTARDLLASRPEARRVAAAAATAAAANGGGGGDGGAGRVREGPAATLWSEARGATDRARVVVLHAPWCGACQAFLPQFRGPVTAGLEGRAAFFAGELRGPEDSKVLQELQESYVPAIYGFRKGSAEPVKFKGSRDRAGVEAFLAELGA